MGAARSAFFNLFFFMWTLSNLIVSLRVTKAQDRPKMILIARRWARGILWALRVICDIKLEVKGIEHIQEGQQYIIASKHQSVWETVIFHIIFDSPIFVLKKELLSVPLFGKYLTGMGMIAIDREAGASALKKMIVDVQDALNHNQPVVIFPEGTRTEPGEKVDYQPGVAALYGNKSIEADVLPVALNSGECWPHSSSRKNPGTVVVSIMPPIKKGECNKKEFMIRLRKTIESESKKIIEASKST
ncbi:MAG: 1-acyl-sn-glycerol-3-phosphate acyltransferase [Rickettsiales bacterium]|nr:1-acyl-sn-glycerol-3-phosphate acyltransferase [Rickettsiales bacterium]